MSRTGSPSETRYSLSSIPQGSYLLSGPANTGKLDWCLEFLLGESGNETPGVMVTTNDAGERVRSRLDYLCPEFTAESATGTDAPRLQYDDYGIVDCTNGTEFGGTTGANIRHVSSPGDLASVGIELTNELERLGASTRGVRLGFHSLTTALMYADRRALFKFLHVLRSRLKSVDGTSVFALDTSIHDEQTVRTLAGCTDGVLEIRASESGTDLKSVDIAGVPSTWTPIR